MAVLFTTWKLLLSVCKVQEKKNLLILFTETYVFQNPLAWKIKHNVPVAIHMLLQKKRFLTVAER